MDKPIIEEMPDLTMFEIRQLIRSKAYRLPDNTEAKRRFDVVDRLLINLEAELGRYGVEDVDEQADEGSGEALNPEPPTPEEEARNDEGVLRDPPEGSDLPTGDEGEHGCPVEGADVHTV